MPLYEYECKKCGKHFEKIEKYQGPYLKKCPSCGGGVERLMSPPAIQFKGSGWYVTDYARGGTGGGEKRDGGSSSEKSREQGREQERDQERIESGNQARVRKQRKEEIRERKVSEPPYSFSPRK